MVTSLDDKALIDVLQSGGVAIIRTDTLYGIVTRADKEASVERVYSLKKRSPDKSPIVLLASAADMFDVPPQAMQSVLRSVWPGPVSVITPAVTAPTWLTRGNHSVAYRVPANEALRALLEQTGPLIAPSANPESLPPATNIDQAKQYFGDTIDIYVDGGTVQDITPSHLLRVHDDGSVERLR